MPVQLSEDEACQLMLVNIPAWYRRKGAEGRLFDIALNEFKCCQEAIIVANASLRYMLNSKNKVNYSFDFISSYYYAYKSFTRDRELITHQFENYMYGTWKVANHLLRDPSNLAQETLPQQLIKLLASFSSVQLTGGWIISSCLELLNKDDFNLIAAQCQRAVEQLLDLALLTKVSVASMSFYESKFNLEPALKEAIQRDIGLHPAEQAMNYQQSAQRLESMVQLKASPPYQRSKSKTPDPLPVRSLSAQEVHAFYTPPASSREHQGFHSFCQVSAALIASPSAFHDSVASPQFSPIVDSVSASSAGTPIASEEEEE